MSKDRTPKCSKPIGRDSHERRTWAEHDIPLFPLSRLAIVANVRGERKLEKAFGVKLNHPPAFLPEAQAAANTRVLKRGRDGAECYVVSVNLEAIVSAGVHAHAQLAGVVSHEASHIADYIFQRVGEGTPGTETRAYLTQWITEVVSQFYCLRFTCLR